MSELTLNPGQHPATPLPQGQPTKLNPHLTTAIGNAIRASANIGVACAHARISRTTHQRWMKDGEQELHTLATTLNTTPDTINLDDIDPHTYPHCHYRLTVEKALADYQLENLALIGTAAAPHEVKTTRVVRKVNAEGKLVEETTETTSRSEQSWQAAAWLLERRFPNDYGRAQRLEVSGPDGGAIEVSAESPGARLAKALGEMQEREEATRSALEQSPAILDVAEAGADEEEGGADGEREE